MMIWVNSKEQQTLTAHDRAVQFGDGCFTTARIYNGKLLYPEAHLQRLQQACERLKIGGMNWSLLEKEMRYRAGTCKNGVLKVIITRGSGGRGYSARGCLHPTQIIVISDYPIHYHRLRRIGVRLALSRIQLGKNTALAGIKHLNRLEQVLICAELEHTDADEMLVLDSDGMLVECCAANLFWRVGKQVFTPDLSASGVNGIQRQKVMQQIRTLGYNLSEVSSPLEALATTDEVFITNALMPVLPVHQINNWHYESRKLFTLINTINNYVETA